MLYAYPAAFFRDNDGWTVIFPDLNYTGTCGKTFEEAQRMSIDCMAGCIYSALKDGDTIPQPSSLADVTAAKVAEHQGFTEPSIEEFVNIVSVDVQEYAKEHFDKKV